MVKGIIFFAFELWFNHNMKGDNMGEKILSTLIKLLAQQENVKIKYEVKKDEK